MNISEYMKTNCLFLDGGMGTLLQDAGLRPGEHPEEWNLSHPEIIQSIHRRYFEAGSHVVNTNTFGANRLHFSPAHLEEIIAAAVENAHAARKAAWAEHPMFVALDIGPSGRLLEPYGDFPFEEAVSLFAEVVRLGKKHGVDLITIETMNDSYETKAALLAAKEECALPVFVTNAYGEDQKLMTGASPEAMAALLEGMGADAIGVNCSLGPAQLSPVIRRLLAVCSVPVILKPNAGLPASKEGKTVYDVSPDAFAELVAADIAAGVRVAGGCCGTTPDYIRALVKKAGGISPLPVTPKETTVVSSYTHTVTFGASPVLIGERLNPTGKKRLKEALRAGDMEYILKEGLAQQEKGVHILDVNVGLPEIDEADMLRRTVTELQAVSDLPLQIDTSDESAMEAALRVYNGKPLVNSVNGKEESMRTIFPLVKKYGGAVIALTLDESGIPATAEGRVKIAEKILNTAKEYGISKKDIIFDTLAMTVSADPHAAEATLGALSVIRRTLGCHTSLGVSNVSFGLPARNAITGVFFAEALSHGLSAAIMNPDAVDMMKTYYSYRALHGMDENFRDYIAFSERYTESKTADAASSRAEEVERSALSDAIIKGLKESAAALTEELSEHTPALELVNREIIPALDAVGQGFEAKKVYLPQLLMSAEAAKAAFEVIKAHMKGQQGEAPAKCPFVIATVHGDIHDIGKNIVKLLLENYGYAVSDLGKNVPPEDIVSEVIRLKAPMAGLSALMTTTVPAMEDTVRLLHEKAPWCKVLVGGAVLTKDYADQIGADFYAADAMESVRYAEKTFASLT